VRGALPRLNYDDDDDDERELKKEERQQQYELKKLELEMSRASVPSKALPNLLILAHPCHLPSW